jgi:hypothetical protein
MLRVVNLTSDHERLIAQGLAAADDPRALLKPAQALGPTVDAMLLAAGGPVPPALAACFTHDPWSGEPVRRAPAKLAARRRHGGSDA